jgi:hypothetical protein
MKVCERNSQRIFFLHVFYYFGENQLTSLVRPCPTPLDLNIRAQKYRIVFPPNFKNSNSKITKICERNPERICFVHMFYYFGKFQLSSLLLAKISLDLNIGD